MPDHGVRLELSGGCVCCAIRYQLASRPIAVHCCHCRWCQRETGASFALNAIIETDRVIRLQGRSIMVSIPSQSGRGQKIARCGVCQIALWSHYAGAGEKVSFVRVGTLDRPELLPPTIHIYTSSRQPWIEVPAGVAAVEEFYRAEDHWPPESLERWRQLGLDPW